MWAVIPIDIQRAVSTQRHQDLAPAIVLQFNLALQWYSDWAKHTTIRTVKKELCRSVCLV